MSNKFTDLVMRADIAASVLANDDGTDVELLNIRPCPTTDEELDELAHRLAGRNLGWVGVVALIDGVPQVALNELPPPGCFTTIYEAFVRHCEAINGVEKGDEVEFLRRLWSLEDPRP